MTAEPPERHRRSALAPSRSVLARALLAHASLLAVAWAGVGRIGIPTDISAGSLTVPALLIVLAMLINSLYVAAQTAIDALRPLHVKALDKDSKQAGIIQVLLDDQSRFVAACRLGGQILTAAMVVLSFLPAPWIAERMLQAWNVPYGWVSVLTSGAALGFVVLALNLTLSELVPRTYASLHTVGVALRLNRFAIWSAAILWLPVLVILAIGNVFTRRFGARATFATPNMAEEEIRELAVTAQESGEIEQEERELLHSVFEFGDTVAREVMTPRVDIDAMPITSDPMDVVTLIRESGHSRIPLYEDTDDQIIGIIHAKDLLLALLQNGQKPINLRTLVRPALFVPENKPLHNLLGEMRASRSQMAIIQDEFGGTAGIVTVEDIVEELVGEIIDEYDVEEPEILSNGTGYIVDGKVNLDDLNHEIGSEFESEEFDTIGGYVFGLFGRQPKLGEIVENEGYRFTVDGTDGRRISKVHVERMMELVDDLDVQPV